MKRGLILFACAIALGSEAHAGPRAFPFITAPPPTHAQRTLTFRLVEDPEFDSDPIHHFGFVAQMPVAPNAMVGIGLAKSQPKKLSGDWTRDSGSSHSRKAALDFLLRF